MIELIKLTRERSNGLTQSDSYFLQKTMLLALKLNKQPRSFIKKFWLKNCSFLIDLSVKRKNFFDRVHHIIQTYGGPNLKVFLPWVCAEFIIKSILHPIMSDIIKQEVLKFKGSIELQPENIPVESQVDQFQREQHLYFSDNADVDEMNDLLNICVPHLSINETLVDKPLRRIILALSNGTLSNEDFLNFFSGLRILNYDKITRETNKSNELSPVTITNIEISKVLVTIKDRLISAVTKHYKDIINSTPLMCINDTTALTIRK